MTTTHLIFSRTTKRLLENMKPYQSFFYTFFRAFFFVSLLRMTQMHEAKARFFFSKLTRVSILFLVIILLNFHFIPLLLQSYFLNRGADDVKREFQNVT